MNIPVTENFARIMQAYQEGKSGIVLEGGSRSGKTYAASTFCLQYGLTNKNKVITTGRDKLTTYKKTQFITIKAANHQLGNHYQFNKTEMTSEVFTGSLFRGVGLNDDIFLTHGLEQDLFWINEAMSVAKETFDQLEQRTNDFWILDYNPSAVDHWVYDLTKRPDVAFFRSTIINNTFASKAVRRKIFSYKPTPENIERGTADKYLWSVYGLGERAIEEDRIFKKLQRYSITPKDYDLKIHGGDFGFSNDPAALEEVIIDGRNLYIKEIFRETGLINSELAILAEKKGVQDEVQVWDSSEPKSITELRHLNINAIPATKGVDSLIFGVRKLQGYNIFIHVDSDDTYNEFAKYKFAKKSNGEYVTDAKGRKLPKKGKDHSIDAVRYAVTKYINV